MTDIIVELAISPEAYLAHYQGTAKDVIAKTPEGKTVRFPSNILQSFVSREGIHGRFAITIDKGNRFKGIRRVG